MISEQTSQLQELRRQLSLREQELRELKRDKEREMGGETEHLRSLLKEKEALIKVLVRAFPPAFPTCSCTPCLHNILNPSGTDAGPRGGDAAAL